MASFVIGPLAAAQDRTRFACGVDALDKYLREQAGQDIRRRVANCFVASPRGSPETIAGYYTLAAASIPLIDLPSDIATKLPRYPVLPAALVGRLAVDRQFQKRALGAALLFDAIGRASKADPAVFAVIVDAKDDRAAAFYRHFGFVAFVRRPRSLFLPVATAAKLIDQPR